MFTETISQELALELEAGDTNAWLDMYTAVPRQFADQFQLQIRRVGNIVFTLCRSIPFVHFNAVKNFGMAEPASEALLDEILATYRDAGIRHFSFYHIPHCQPPELLAWFKSRGLRQQGGWERIFRNNDVLTDLLAPSPGFQVEKVTRTTASEWAAYIDGLYGLPTTPWLLALVERPGWHHYMLRQGTKIVAVRSMFVDQAGMAWFGIDAPVPGIMVPSFDLDRQICQAMVQDGLGLGVRYFIADIEVPDPNMNTPAYHHFAALGFKLSYFRSHFGY